MSAAPMVLLPGFSRIFDPGSNIVGAADVLHQLSSPRTATSTHTHAHTRTHTYTHMHTNTNTHTHIRTHTCTHAHTHTHTQAHTTRGWMERLGRASCTATFHPTLALCACMRVCVLLEPPPAHHHHHTHHTTTTTHLSTKSGLVALSTSSAARLATYSAGWATDVSSRRSRGPGYV
jgi:hypothetical protein